jgi:hypothetical protein
MGFSTWVGPAIVATIIASLVQVIGWWIEHRRERGRQFAQRRERIVDVQTALRAEIRSHQHRLLQFSQIDEVEPIAGVTPGKPFRPFVPSEVKPFVFEAIVKEVHVLPTDVIDPVVVYYRQVHALIQLVEDLRSERVSELEPERQRAMYRDYIAMAIYAGELAGNAVDAIDRDLGLGAKLNSSDAARSARKSGGAAPEPAERDEDLQS